MVPTHPVAMACICQPTAWGTHPTSFLSDLVEPSFSRSKSDLTSSMRLSPTTPTSTALPGQSMAGDSPLCPRMSPDYRLLEDWVRSHATLLSMVSLCADSFDIVKFSIPTGLDNWQKSGFRAHISLVSGVTQVTCSDYVLHGEGLAYLHVMLLNFISFFSIPIFHPPSWLRSSLDAGRDAGATEKRSLPARS